MNLNFKNIVVYDCEIKNEIGSMVGDKKLGWTDFGLMGLSVACLYDYRDGDFKVYMDDNIGELAERLNTAGLVVGFNITTFDNRLIREIDPRLKNDVAHQESSDTLKTFDILRHTRAALGTKPDMPHSKGMSLDEHLKGTFGDSLMKTAHGSEAPKMWQEKKIGKLVSYCMADVRREKILFEYIVKFGHCKIPTYGEVKCPINWADYKAALA